MEQEQQNEGAAMRSEVERLKEELNASKLQLKAEQTRADAIEKQWIAWKGSITCQQGDNPDRSG